MSSSSSVNGAPSPSVAALLAESFRVLGVEAPAAYADLRQTLSARTIRIELDTEAMEVKLVDGELGVVRERGETHEALVGVGVTTILDVLEARASLRDAVLDGRLRVVASLAQVEALHDALSSYTHAAVRCPSFPGLFARFKSLVRAAKGEAA